MRVVALTAQFVVEMVAFTFLGMSAVVSLIVWAVAASYAFSGGPMPADLQGAAETIVFGGLSGGLIGMAVALARGFWRIRP